MPCNRSNSAAPLPCQMLAQAQAQMVLYLSGQGVVAIETPQLGRVEYSKINVGDLQRLIDTLSVQCAQACGQSTAGMRRRPISMEACP